MYTVDRIATQLGRGILSGLAGTAAITLASTLEMKLRGRPPSNTPARAAEKALGIHPDDARGENRLSNATHWAYGTAWGLARAALDAFGVRGAAAPLAHLGLVWTTAIIMLPAMKLAPPVHKWGAREVAADLFNHVVYAGATDAAFRMMRR